MAPTKTAKVKKETISVSKNDEFLVVIGELIQRIALLEEKVFKTPQTTKINKVELFNNEEIPNVREKSGIKMGDEDKIISMQNAIKILPPNMVINGRHIKDNIEALCGFPVTEEMMDEAYIGIQHEDY